MKKILLVEDSKVFGGMMQKSIQSRLKCQVDWHKSLSSTRDILPDHSEEYLVALLDLHLPDAPNGEIVDMVARFDIPIIVFTSEFSNDVRERIWSKRIVDYVHKEGSDSVNYIVQLIRNLDTNSNTKILVVDDSKMMRNMFEDLLNIHKYTVLTAEDATSALATLKKHQDIKLITVDFHMPDMDGVELVKTIRKNHSKENVVIIGISSSDDKWISARFIKSGANDYLSKPFINEEFYCRITHNLQYLGYIETIRDIANKDVLTGLFNRRYFYEYAESMFRVANQKGIDVNVAILDIDFFKKVNDTYGHDAGDAVLKSFADILSQHVPSPGIVARMGGEEFSIITIGNNLNPLFENIRKTIETTSIKYDTTLINITVSAGVCIGRPDNLSAMLTIADGSLYTAKEEGRNRIISKTIRK